jgi:hypothetical protein
MFKLVKWACNLGARHERVRVEAEGWTQITRYRAKAPNGVTYWVASGFLFLEDEESPVQPNLVEKWKLYRSLARQIRSTNKLNH